MAYLGTPIDTRNQFQSLQGKRFNGDGSTTDFTLDVAPGSVLDIEVFVGNVRQDPNSAYTLSGTTLSFTGAPPSGTNNIYVVHQAKSVGTIDVPALGVSTASIQADAITEAKIADDAVESEHLNNNVISGQTELAATPADTDEFLISDAGTLKRIDYSYIKGGGSLKKVHTITASDDSAVTFNSTYLTSTYKRYTLEAFDIQSANDNVYLELSFSVDNGSNYLTGAITRINISNTSGQGNDAIQSRNTTGQNTLQLGGGTNFGTGTGEVGAFTFELVNFSDTAHYKLLYYNGALFNAGGTGGINLGASTIATTSAINNIKFSFSGGNITAGTFILYGIE